MDKIIPISVAVIITAVSALIVVKEVNKRSAPTVAKQVTPTQKASTTPFKPTYQPSPTIEYEKSQSLTAMTQEPAGKEEVADEAEEEFVDQYTQEENFSDQVDQATFEAYKDYVTNNLEENIAMSHRFTQESEQWNTIVNTTLNTLASNTLNTELSEYQLTRLRSGINQFLNNRIMNVIQNPDNVPQTQAQMQQFGQEAKQEIDYLLQSELGITVEDVINKMNPELINQVMSQYEEKTTNAD